ncbi:MAG: DUF4445 domain-containing protein [Bacteroidales bacterium]|nr:DUF4445 domain-containing protein [Bacteroidales bacterium]
MEKHFTVRLEPLGKKIRVPAGTPLKDILFSYGVEFPCGSKALCGGCRIKVLEGEVSVDTSHRRALEKLGLSDPWRLACRSQVTGDVVLEIGQFDTFILADSTPFRFRPRAGYGIAFDIGTTTLVAQLVNLQSGEVVAVETGVNPQARYGGDVISRIEYAVLQGGADELTRLIREKFSKMTRRLLCKVKEVPPEKILVAGNTVMHHLFCGHDLTPMAAYPFETSHGGECCFTAGELGLPADHTEIVFLPILGSFVGSDILAGILATGMAESEQPVVLVDLGTNGEIVVGNREHILCASTAAGPAFEGTNIRMGMRATTGAISSVMVENGTVRNHIIGNEQARGICGSGLIDAIAVFLEKGDIDLGGRVTTEDERLHLTPQVYLTQKDVRELQLAKSAIASGLQILMEEMGISAGEVKNVFISGAFGTFINLENTRRIGLLKFPEEKIIKMGNTALLGTKMALFEEEEVIRDILEKTVHLSLESNPRFQDIFAENMIFT